MKLESNAGVIKFKDLVPGMYVYSNGYYVHSPCLYVIISVSNTSFNYIEFNQRNAKFRILRSIITHNPDYVAFVKVPYIFWPDDSR